MDCRSLARELPNASGCKPHSCLHPARQGRDDQSRELLSPRQVGHKSAQEFNFYAILQSSSRRSTLRNDRMASEQCADKEMNALAVNELSPRAFADSEG